MSDIDKNNDGLEHFLRKSFEGFAPTPSDTVWDRLSTNLPGNTAPVTTHAIYVKGWLLAAIVGTILLLFGLQYLLLNDKVEDLKEQLDKQNQQINSLVERQQQMPTALPAQSMAAVAVPAPPTFTAPTQPNHTTKKYPISKERSRIAPVESVVGPIIRQDGQVKSDLAASGNAIISADLEPTAANRDTSSLLRPIELAFSPVIPNRAKLPQMVWSEQSDGPRVMFLGSDMTRAYRRPARFSVGLSMAPITEEVQMSAKKETFQNHHHNDRGKIHFNEQPCKGSGLQVGLNVQYPITRHWSVVSGLDFTRLAHQKTVRPEMDFKDRDKDWGGPGGPDPDPGGPGGPGGGDHDHEYGFNYMIGTTAGTYLVEVALNQRDTNMMVDDDEKLSFELKTQEKSVSVGLPLAFQYKHAYKHWAFFARGGVRFNWSVQRTSKLTDFAVDNNLFEVKDAPSLTASDTEYNRFSASTVLSVGLEYKIGPIGIQVAPVWYKNLGKGTDPDLGFAARSKGVNAALQYYF